LVIEGNFLFAPGGRSQVSDSESTIPITTERLSRPRADVDGRRRSGPLTGVELIPGVIVAVQTFGDRINVHPHLHLLVTECGVDGAGILHDRTAGER
jgi:hypothetical protein